MILLFHVTTSIVIAYLFLQLVSLALEQKQQSVLVLLFTLYLASCLAHSKFS